MSGVVESENVLVEDHLGESLSTGSSTEFSGETERLVDGKVSLDGVHGSSRSLLLREDHTTLLVESRVDTSEGVLRALNLDLVDGLLESGLGKKRGSVHDTSASGDKLEGREESATDRRKRSTRKESLLVLLLGGWHQCEG